MHNRMAVDAWLYAMCLASMYTLADAQQYVNSCTVSGHAFESVYTRADAQSYGLTCMALGFPFGVCVYAG